MTNGLIDVPAPAFAELLREIESYLRAVDEFRAAGCEPRWAAEPITPEEELR